MLVFLPTLAHPTGLRADNGSSLLQDPAAGFKGGGPGELSEVLNYPVCDLNGAAEWRTSVPQTQTLDCRAEAAL